MLWMYTPISQKSGLKSHGVKNYATSHDAYFCDLSFCLKWATLTSFFIKFYDWMHQSSVIRDPKYLWNILDFTITNLVQLGVKFRFFKAKYGMLIFFISWDFAVRSWALYQEFVTERELKRIFWTGIKLAKFKDLWLVLKVLWYAASLRMASLVLPELDSLHGLVFVLKYSTCFSATLR